MTTMRQGTVMRTEVQLWTKLYNWSFKPDDYKCFKDH